MTRSREKGENEITDEAMREALRTGREVADILEDMLRAAKKAGDAKRRKKIERAQKYRRLRNRRKRRGR